MPTQLKGHVLGIPVWVWGAAVGGAIIVGLYLRHRSASAQATDAANTTGTDASGSDTSGTGDMTDAGNLGPAGDGAVGAGNGDFSYAPPPAGTTGLNANGNLDPALRAAIDRRFKHDLEEQRKQDKEKRKHHRGHKGHPDTPDRNRRPDKGTVQPI